MSRSRPSILELFTLGALRHGAGRPAAAGASRASCEALQAAVAQHFRRLGFVVDSTGVDVLVRCADETYVVECKHWRSRRVGLRAVRELQGLMAAHRAAGAFVVSSGGFTRFAEAFAGGREIQLLDLRKLDFVST